MYDEGSDSGKIEIGDSLGFCTQREDSDDELDCFGSSHGLLTQCLPDNDSSEESEDDTCLTEEECPIGCQNGRKKDNRSIEVNTGNDSYVFGLNITKVGVLAEGKNDEEKEGDSHLQGENLKQEKNENIFNNEDPTNDKLSNGREFDCNENIDVTKELDRDYQNQREESSAQIFSEESDLSNEGSSKSLERMKPEIESDVFDTISDADLPQAGFTDDLESIRSNTNDLDQSKFLCKDETRNGEVPPIHSQLKGIALSKKSLQFDPNENREDSQDGSDVESFQENGNSQDKKDFKLFSVYSGETQSLPSQLNETFKAKSENISIAPSKNVFDKKIGDPTLSSTQQSEKMIPVEEIPMEGDSICKDKELLTSPISKKGQQSIECCRNGIEFYTDSYYNRSTGGFTAFDKDEVVNIHDMKSKLDNLNEAETLEWKGATLSLSSHDSQKQNCLLDPTLTADNAFSYASDVVVPTHSRKQGHSAEQASNSRNATQRLKKSFLSNPLTMTPHSQDLLHLLRTQNKGPTVMVQSQSSIKIGTDKKLHKKKEPCNATPKKLEPSVTKTFPFKSNEKSDEPTISIMEVADKTDDGTEKRRNNISEDLESSASHEVHPSDKATSMKDGANKTEEVNEGKCKANLKKVEFPTSEDNQNPDVPMGIKEGTDEVEDVNGNNSESTLEDVEDYSRDMTAEKHKTCDTKTTYSEGDSATQCKREEEKRKSTGKIMTTTEQVPRGMHDINDEIVDSDDNSTIILSKKKTSHPIESLVDDVGSSENIDDTSSSNQLSKQVASKEDGGNNGNPPLIELCINKAMADNSIAAEKSEDDDLFHDESLPTDTNVVENDPEYSDEGTQKGLIKLCSLTDTQPDEEECATNSFRRLTRDFKQRSNKEREKRTKKDPQMEEDQKDYDAVSLSCRVPEYSQKTVAIRAQMRQLATINVNQLAANLHQTPDFAITQLEEQLLELREKNETLESKKKEVEIENKVLRKEVQECSAKLEAKNNLCEEMSKQIARLQPLIDAAVKFGNMEGCDDLSVSRKFNGDKKDQNETFADSVTKIVHVDRDEATHPKESKYLTPQRLNVKKKAVPISISTQKGRKGCPHVHGNLTFLVSAALATLCQIPVQTSYGSRSQKFIFGQELWRILQERGWTHKTGPEPYGKVYVSPNGNVRKGSKLGTDFFFGNDLWKKAEELGITNNEESNDHMDDTAISDDDIPISALKNTDAWNSPHPTERNRSIVEPARAVIEKGVEDDDLGQKRRRRKRSLSPCGNQYKGNPPTADQRKKVTEMFVEAKKQKGSPTEMRRRKPKLAVIRDTPSPPQIKRPTYSQNAMEGAEILLGMINSENEVIEETSGSRRALEYKNYVTKEGVKAMVEFRKSRKQKRKDVSETTHSKKRQRRSQKKECTTNRVAVKTKVPSVVYHLSQFPEDDTVKAHRSLKLHKNTALPLDGMTFFASGASPEVERTVVKLGAKFLRDIGGDLLKESNVYKKLMFLSDAEKRRTHKYILASALGVPMLHFNWITAFLNKFEKYQQTHSESFKSVKRPSPFDSVLYASHRYVFYISVLSLISFLA